jgi:hypothetical protein
VPVVLTCAVVGFVCEVCEVDEILASDSLCAYESS